MITLLICASSMALGVLLLLLTPVLAYFTKLYAANDANPLEAVNWLPRLTGLAGISCILLAIYGAFAWGP